MKALINTKGEPGIELRVLIQEFHAYFLLALLFTFPYDPLYSQSTLDSQLSQSAVTFEFASTKMTVDGEEHLDRVVKSYLKFEDIIKEKGLRFKLGGCYCYNEMQIDPFIGVKRAKVVVDFLERRTNLARDEIYMIDLGPCDIVPSTYLGSEPFCYLSEVIVGLFEIK